MLLITSSFLKRIVVIYALFRYVKSPGDLGGCREGAGNFSLSVDSRGLNSMIMEDG
jgi:hypothetical protein